jgi:outer membrane protein OmpA-like peptidoglycan-associated protein
MKAKRTALFGVLVSLICATASAQLAPNTGGDIGLFTMPTADQPEPGHFTLGAYGWLTQLIAGPLITQDIPEQNRVYRQTSFEGSLGFGFTRNWSIFASAGGDEWKNRGGWQGGAVAGVPFPNDFTVTQGRKLRVGTKVSLFSENDPNFRVGLWVTSHIPINNTATVNTPGFSGTASINSSRTDWEWGAAVSKGVVTGMVQYVLSGRNDLDIRPSNLLRFGLGADFPITESLHTIGELTYTISDGGDLPAPNYGVLNAGIRYWIGRTGFAISTALGMNLNLLINHGNNPAPWGGVLGVTYAAFPPPPPPPVEMPPPAPTEKIVEQVQAAPAPAPAPAAAPAPPPPPTPKKTTDEIFFDAGSARLTNIAKAMLDGIALRMKNDLNATAAITGYSDNSGKEDANVAISAKRAEAAKEYLVTRHGIDPNRITTAAKGSQDAAYDNTTPEGRGKNRRAVIVVTLISGA